MILESIETTPDSVMLREKEYLISNAQAQQILRGCPPPAVRNVLATLTRVDQVLLTGHETRRSSMSVLKALKLGAKNLLKSRAAGKVDKPLSIISGVLGTIGDCLLLAGVLYSCHWGISYVGSQQGADLNGATVATVFALAVAAIGVIAIVTRIIKIILEKDVDRLSGFAINEEQVQEILKSSTAPGYVIKILDNLPVIFSYQNSDADLNLQAVRDMEADATLCHIAPSATEQQEPKRWWAKPVLLVALLSMAWLAFGALLTEHYDYLQTIGAVAVLAFVLDVLVCWHWAHKTDRLIAQRPGLTW
ncbi:hypothetical protein H8F21_14285 [Pseudomonas sp. P66]|uniref:Uncharacterized protein n=1 Tax=Pseudomonas arcuscaelestis TaxID=2710591 RepID=A0ABS2BYM8_9PSED|nr:hypothetical protein [Pseudomonas arcuscaelestis]MBM5458732.1 hypothetical protein [Pseudomonas arcuscaelestis]